MRKQIAFVQVSLPHKSGECHFDEFTLNVETRFCEWRTCCVPSKRGAAPDQRREQKSSHGSSRCVSNPLSEVALAAVRQIGINRSVDADDRTLGYVWAQSARARREGKARRDHDAVLMVD